MRTVREGIAGPRGTVFPITASNGKEGHIYSMAEVGEALLAL
jgi:hypothetical protein